MNSTTKGGRPALGASGQNRVSVRIMEPGDGGYSLSLLPIQREFLASVGGGNRSEGFRRIVRFLAQTAEIQELLKHVIYQYVDPALETVRDKSLVDWLAELDRILEHGRAETATVDGEKATSP